MSQAKITAFERVFDRAVAIVLVAFTALVAGAVALA